MTVLWIVLAALAVAVVLVLVIGALLPAEHQASDAVVVRAPAERVYDLLVDVARAPRWRTDLKAVDVLGEHEGRLQYRETGKFGVVLFELVERTPPTRVVTRVADEKLAFGGTWTWILTPDPSGGTRVAVTEDGVIRNAAFRFMARFLFGYDKTIDEVLGALAAHFEPTRSDD
ncbi:MAG: SRPBCC family protein [Deltaproteobacteria bacterium]|nr:MAG: SRPBCC family protein [Deltaproteobacteria bacterium]